MRHAKNLPAMRQRYFSERNDSIMDPVKHSSYAFSDAYTAGLSGRLLTWSDLSDLASCRDAQEVTASLAEYGYGQQKPSGYGRQIGHEESETPGTSDTAVFVKRERELLRDMIRSTVPSPEVFDAYFLQSDYHNAKVCLKATFLGIDPPEDLLETGGVYEASEMIRMVRERDDISVPREIRDALSEASELFRRSRDPQDIDIVMDRACFRQMAATAAGSGDDFITGFVRLQTDLCDLRTFMRAKAAGDPRQFFHRAFIAGGNIGEDVFMQVYEEPYEQSAEALEPYFHAKAAGAGLREAFEHGGHGMTEKYCDDILMEYCRQAKYRTFGPAPVAGYIYGKKTELLNLRIILAGVSAGQSAGKTRERLRIPYV